MNEEQSFLGEKETHESSRALNGELQIYLERNFRSITIINIAAGE
jgi:hypothetical protein